MGLSDLRASFEGVRGFEFFGGLGVQRYAVLEVCVCVQAEEVLRGLCIRL